MILDGDATGAWCQQGDADYNVFDILWIDGRDVTGLTLDERRTLLASIRFRSPVARVLPLDDDKPWERACADGWEGVIAKRRDSTYEHRRSPHWLKMKCEASQELVIGGFDDARGTRLGLGALLVGYFENSSCLPAKSGPGSSRRCFRTSARSWTPPRSPQPLFTKGTGLPRKGARWVRPEIVVQVASSVDRPRQAPASQTARPPDGQGRARRREGARVITHPDKVLFPDAGSRKGSWPRTTKRSRR